MLMKFVVDPQNSHENFNDGNPINVASHEYDFSSVHYPRYKTTSRLRTSSSLWWWVDYFNINPFLSPHVQWIQASVVNFGILEAVWVCYRGEGTPAGRGVRVARGKTNESAAKIVIGFRKIIRILRHPVVERCRSTIFRIRRRGGKGGEPLAWARNCSPVMFVCFGLYRLMIIGDIFE